MTVVADRFVIRELAGRGGLGDVFRATDRRDGSSVAVKVLRTKRAARLERESEVIARITHPHVVRYVAHGTTDDGHPFLAMEWLPGIDLEERLRHGPLAIDETLELGARLSGALAEAHAHGVVHRDVKPANVVLADGRLDEPRLIDFGVAFVDDDRPALTQYGIPLGTPAYMAPEQARGEPVDARADVFALGAVLYEALTGRRAFAGDDAVSALAEILLADPPALSSLRPDTPPALEALVHRMLSKDRDRRPRDGAEVAAALREAAGGPPRVHAALGSGEVPHLSVVVLGTRDAAAVDDRELGAVAAAHGVALARLPSGHRLATIRGGEATDRAQLARRLGAALFAASPDARIAIASGQARPQGSAPLGEVVDRALALLRALPRGGVVADDPTARLLAGRAGAASVAMHGRARELSWLEQTVDADEGAVCVLLSGEPGIGKTRLLSALHRRLVARDAPPDVWVGRADAARAAQPFAVVADALAARFDLDVDDPPAARRALARVCERLVASAEVDRTAGFLAEMIGVSGEGGVAVALRADPSAMRAQLHRAVEVLARATCARRPLLVVLEDAQWADAASLRLIAHLLERLADAPLVVACGVRPDGVEALTAAWAGRPLVHRVVGPLGPASAGRLVRDVLGPDAPEPRVRAIVERGAGHPFYLQELARAPADGGPPASVLAMVQSRLSRLPAGARRVLRAASVQGVRFQVAGVAALLRGEPLERDLGASLAELEAAGLLRGDPSVPGGWAFEHRLIQEAAYATLPDADRELGHRLLAAWLLARGGAPAVVAEHLERGGRAAEAAPLWVRAAADAVAAGELGVAEERLDRAGDRGVGAIERGVACAIEAEVAMWRGEQDRVYDASRRARALLTPPHAAWCAAIATSALAAEAKADHVELAAIADELGTALEAHASPELLVAAVRAAHALHDAGLPALAASIEPSILRDDAHELDPRCRAWRLRYRSSLAARAGEVEALMGLQRRTVDAFDALGDAPRTANERINLGWLVLRRGAVGEAVAILERALSEATELGFGSMVASAEQNLAAAVLEAGDAERAVELARRSAAVFAAEPDHRLEAASRTTLAEAELARGRLAAAAAAVAAAREASDRAGGALVPWIEATAGRVALARGDARRARQHTRAAVDALDPLDDAPDPDGFDLLAWVAHADALLACGEVGRALSWASRALERLEADAARLDHVAAGELLGGLAHHRRAREIVDAEG